MRFLLLVVFAPFVYAEEERPSVPQIHHPRYFYTIEKIEADKITLSDGSIWRVDKKNIPQLSVWKKDHLAVISLNSYWWRSSCRYIMTNQTKGSYIYVNFYSLSLGHRMLTVKQPYKHNNTLLLSDGSLWQIDRLEWYLFEEWSPGNSIILGHNSDTFSSHNYILINVNMNKYVHASLMDKPFN